MIDLVSDLLIGPGVFPVASQGGEEGRAVHSLCPVCAAGDGSGPDESHDCVTDHRGSVEAHGEQHITLYYGLHRVRHIRLQDDRLATADLKLFRSRLDSQLASNAVNYHVARGAMLRQTPPWIEREQEQPERTPMNQTRLPMSILGRVRLRMQSPGEIWKIERYHWACQPRVRMRPQTLVCLVHCDLRRIEPRGTTPFATYFVPPDTRARVRAMRSGLPPAGHPGPRCR